MELNARLATASNDGQSSPTVTSLATGRAYTPTSTTADGLSETASTVGIGLLSDDVPWPGKTYKIRHRESRRLITLAEGTLRLQLPEATKATGGTYWFCAENNGWWGFRNSISGTYIGYSVITSVDYTATTGRFTANTQQYGAEQCFCIRRHPEGGYVILVRYLKEGLRQMVVNEGTGQLVAKAHGRYRFSEEANDPVRNEVLGEAQWLFEEV